MVSLDKVKFTFITLLVLAVFMIVMIRLVQERNYPLDKLTLIISQTQSIINSITNISVMDLQLFSAQHRRNGDLLADDSYKHVIDMSTHVAIGCAITSRGRKIEQRQNSSIFKGRKIEQQRNMDILKAFPLFAELLPSFCTTATPGYSYHFYVAYDFTDVYFTDRITLLEFQRAFDSVKCSNLTLTLHMVKCHHSGKPAWAQNDAMVQAYTDNMEYFYRVNDDTEMLSANWTDVFVNQLRQFNPPNVGVVGPYSYNGNVDILTYDFVHRTHLDIFGYYYPRQFPGWYADAWITNVYKKAGNRSKKVTSVKVEHTMTQGTRYDIHKEAYRDLHRLIGEGQQLIER